MSAPIAERLHEQLHKLPGMPPHPEAARLNQSSGARPGSAHNRGGPPALAGHHPSLRNPGTDHARPPRVLVAWQNWIRGVFTGRKRKG